MVKTTVKRGNQSFGVNFALFAKRDTPIPNPTANPVSVMSLERSIWWKTGPASLCGLFLRFFT